MSESLHEPAPMFKDMSGAPDQAAVLAILQPELQPAPEFTPQDKARQFITDFAGRYATTPTTRSYLQTAINTAQAVNCPIAPSERGSNIMSFTHCFEMLLAHDPSLNDQQRAERMTQLRDSLAALSEPFELPSAPARAR